MISSSPYVKLPDGFYTLTATVKNTDGFSQLEMYAESAGKRMASKINGANPQWATIEIKQIAVKDGKVEIGFHADGNANASCQIDDVSLVKE
jgi:hypothetical protein